MYHYDEEKALLSLQRKALRLVLFLLWVAIGYILIKLGSHFQEIVSAYSVAILISYLLAKPVSFLTRYIRYRAASVLLIYFGFFSSIALITYYLLPEVITQLKSLRVAMPYLIMKLDQVLIELNTFLLVNYQIQLPLEKFQEHEFIYKAVSILTNLNLHDAGATMMTLLFSSVTVILYAVMTLVLSFYLMVDGQKAWELFLMPFSDRHVKHMLAIKTRIDQLMHAYIVGQFEVALLTSSVMLITYFSLGVPYALLFGLIQMLEIIPLLGTWAAIVPCIAIIFFTSGMQKAMIAFGVYLFYTQIIRDNFIAPKILGRALGFHPLGIIIAVIVGAKLNGVFGVIFALPMLAVINAVINYFAELSRLKVRFNSSGANASS